jgi:hypothetical protein
MTASKKIKSLPALALIALALLGIYVTYHLVIFLSKAFVFLGFNLFLYTDNLLKFDSSNPLILWGLLGLFIGSIFGVIVAIKKYNLSKVLILYPLSITIFGMIILSFINKPTDVGSTYSPVKTEESTIPQPLNVALYTTTRAVNIRSGPSPVSKKLFILPKGTQVEVIEYKKDSRNNTWSKIGYIDPKTGFKETGYVNASYLK